MGRSPSDYIAMALISGIEWEDSEGSYSFGSFHSKKTFAGDLDALKAHAEERTGLKLDDQTISEAIRTLADCGFLRITDDAFAGRYVKIFDDRLPAFIAAARDELDRSQKEDGGLAVFTNKSDFPSAYALLQHDIVNDYHELGDDWLQRALEGLQRFQREHGRLPLDGEQTGTLLLPASDRYVTLDHNQQRELEESTTELIEALERENSVDGDPSIRAWMLGQLRAARELFRAKVLDAWIAKVLLMDLLRSLKEKYEGHIIGATAATLMELMIKHINGAA